MKKRFIAAVAATLLIVGVSIMAYPYFMQQVSNQKNKQVIEQYTAGNAKNDRTGKERTADCL